jgi:hypothetical protein
MPSSTIEEDNVPPSKTKAVREAILRNIERGDPGFTDRLPAYRELAKEFDVSVHVVFSAFKQLESEGIVECRPWKGAQVVRRSGPSARRLHLLICERLAWQIIFWYEVIERFEQVHPDVAVRPHFVTELENSDIDLMERHEEHWVVVRTGESRPAGVPAVELRHIFEPREAKRLFRDLKPLFKVDPTQTTLPYQLQVPALVYRRERRHDPPSVDWTWPECITWLRSTYGTKSVDLPVLSLVLDSCGVRSLRGKKVERMAASPALRRLVEVVVALVESEVRLEESLGDDTIAAMFSNATLGATFKTSFTWPALGLGGGNDLSVWPLPVEKGAFAPGSGLFMFMTGTTPTDEGAEWFKFIMSEDFQLLQMQKGFGLSPRRSFRNQVLAEPDRFVPGLDRILDQIERRRLRFGAAAALLLTHAEALSLVFRHISTSLLGGGIKKSHVLEVTRAALGWDEPH